MKILLLAFALIILGANQVRAEEVTSNREERVEMRKQVKQEIKEKFQEKLQENRDKRAENHANRLERRFKFYYERMSKIMDKFQKRIDYLKDQGKNVTAVQTKLDSAVAKLEEARKKGEEAISAFRAVDPTKWEEQKTQIKAARDLAILARSLYADTKVLLKAALTELKTIVKPALPAASTAVNNSL